MMIEILRTCEKRGNSKRGLGALILLAFTLSMVAKAAAREEKPQSEIIEVAPASIQYVTYDAKGPKPPVLGVWQAAMQPQLQCNVTDVDLKIVKNADRSHVVQAKSMRVAISMALTITLPQDCDARLKAYEEERRKIYEYFYNTYAERAARLGAAIALDKQFSCQDKSTDDAKAQARAQIPQVVSEQFKRYVTEPIRLADARFKDRTDHNRNSLDLIECAKDSIDMYRIRMLKTD